MTSKEYKEWRRFIRSAQLNGYTRAEAVRMWHDANEIAEVIGPDDEHSEGEIRDAIEMHQEIRKALGD